MAKILACGLLFYHDDFLLFMMVHGRIWNKNKLLSRNHRKVLKIDKKLCFFEFKCFPCLQLLWTENVESDNKIISCVNVCHSHSQDASVVLIHSDFDLNKEIFCDSCNKMKVIVVNLLTFSFNFSLFHAITFKYLQSRSFIILTHGLNFVYFCMYSTYAVVEMSMSEIFGFHTEIHIKANIYTINLVVHTF